MSDARKVAISVICHSFYGREAMQGIFHYVNMGAKWEMHYEGLLALKRMAVAIDQWKAHGILAQISDRRLWDLIVRSKLPAVNISGDFREGVVNVCPDNQAVGVMAAEHLLGRGLKHFAYCGVSSEGHSVDREQGFVETIRAAGHPCKVFRVRLSPRSWDWYNDYLRLGRWLGSLPKPVGVMACNDYIARYVMWSCQRAGIKVPDEVPVIGVDNDDLEGSLCRVPLSSVNLPIRLIGQRAAEVLEQMMRGRPAPAGDLLIPPTEVIVRQSTDVYASADEELVAVLRQIHDRSSEPMSVAEIVRQKAISRRSLEKRFIKAFGFTPGAEIQRARLERAKRLLSVTDMKITGVPAACGFARYSTFSHMFRRKTGMTPGQYRKKFRVTDRPGAGGT